MANCERRGRPHAAAGSKSQNLLNIRADSPEKLRSGSHAGSIASRESGAQTGGADENLYHEHAVADGGVGGTAAGALLIAVLTTRSEVGAERVGTVLSSLRGPSPASPSKTPVQVTARSPETEAETRRLVIAVRDLAAREHQLKSRVAAVEHTVDDVTGSITRQIEAVKTELPPLAVR